MIAPFVISPRAEGDANIFGVFRVKNHDFTPKNHIFPILGGWARNFWGISCEKSRFYAKKIIFLPILGRARAGCVPPPESAPVDGTEACCSKYFETLYTISLDCEFRIVFRVSDISCCQSKIDIKDERGALLPISRGQRLIVVHGGGCTGYVPGALLVWKATSSTGDYHNEMNGQNF
jgi:hypothetical protein